MIRILAQRYENYTFSESKIRVCFYNGNKDYKRASDIINGKQPPFRIGKNGCMYEGNEENEKEELI